jgi:D-cysteine desulfhydrase
MQVSTLLARFPHSPLPLVHGPTPLEPLPGPTRRLGVELWVKRDDLAGVGLSGNKVRKLSLIMAEAQAAGAQAVVTCGGIQSNHCRATAVAARRLGLRPVLLLRGQAPATGRALDGNLLLGAMLGAEIHWCTPEGYADRDAKMAQVAADLPEKAFVIPEGGSNATGALAFALAAEELQGQAEDEGVGFDTVIVPVGSGGTVAGLAMGGLSSQVLGIAVCDSAAFFRTRVEALAAASADRFGTVLGGHWDIDEAHIGRGYGLTTPEELRLQARFSRETGQFLDPCYTGKAWVAVERMLAENARSLGRRVLFWHTGGVFGLFGRGEELSQAGVKP